MNLKNNTQLEKSAELCINKIMENNFHQNPQYLLQKKISKSVKELGCEKDYKCIYPYKLFWRITANCNLRCKHCYFYGNDEKFSPDEDLSTKRALELIDELAEMEVINLILTGGEIFTRKDIFYIIEKLKSKNIPVSLSTNATLLSEETAAQLGKILNPLIDNIQISLDGATKETHELTRGLGNFDKTIRGIKLLVQEGLQVSINTTITSKNVMEIPDLYKLANSLGVKKISYSKLSILHESQSDIIPERNQVVIGLAEAIKLEKELKNTFLEILGLEIYDLVNLKIGEKFLDKYLKKIKKLDIYNCSCQNGNKAYIDSQGDLYLCHLSANNSKYKFGNIKNKSFKEEWANRNSNVLFQPRNSDNLVCKECKYIPFCKGACPFYAHEYYETILAPNPNCDFGRSLMSENKVLVPAHHRI